MGKNYFHSSFHCRLPAIFLVFFFTAFGINNAEDRINQGKKPGNRKIAQEKVKVSEGFVAADDGVRLFYRKVGEGPGTVIIPNALYMFNSFKHLAEDYTVIFYDLRNRGRSDPVSDPEKLKKGIHNDVDDLETIRRHLGSKKVDLIGHSYLGLIVILYTMKYPGAVNRVVQIGALPLKSGTTYPVHLTSNDKTPVLDANKMKELQELEKKGYNKTNPKEYCKKWWSLYSAMYVVDPENGAKVYEDCCNYENEWPDNLLKHFTQNILPSIMQLKVSWEEIKKLPHPVLTIHGKKDRNAPYGSGREWAFNLANARLVTVEKAAHVPWIESPEMVFAAIKTFLGGKWPQKAEVVKKIDPSARRTASRAAEGAYAPSKGFLTRIK